MAHAREVRRPRHGGWDVSALPWNDDVAEILGKPNFWCGPLANLLRVAGQSIPSKAEAEQAAVIYWLLGLHFAHGSEWRDKAREFIDELSAQLRAAKTAAKPVERATTGDRSDG